MNMNCKNCETWLNICKPFSACFATLKIQRPNGFIPNLITVSISNAQKVNFKQQCAIVNDLITPDLALFPAGFISAYGGPYSLEFFNVTTGEQINFIATNGNKYNCVTFGFQNGSGVLVNTINF